MMEDDQPKQGIEQEEKQKVIHGGRNLVLLGIGSIVIALITTSISIFIYRYTGDIYLDRSRPGFLPDEDEKDDDDPIEEYTFDKSGEFTEEVLKEYSTKFGEVMQNIEEYEKPFGGSALSDEALGI